MSVADFIDAGSQQFPIEPARRLGPSAALPTAAAEGIEYPRRFVRVAVYLSVFAIPFLRVYLPGTGERVGVTRLVQVLMIFAVLSQPRVCLRFLPWALIGFGAYCGMRVLSGLMLTPELSASWWPVTLDWLQLWLPWVWVLFNVLHHPTVRRGTFWALALGASLCALFHSVGVGASDLAAGRFEDVRSTVFGENANIVGETYALGLIAAAGLGMLKETSLAARLAVVPLAATMGLGLAKTGSRTGLFIVGVGLAVLLFQARAFLPRGKRYATMLLVAAVLVAALSQVPTVLKRLQEITRPETRHRDARARMIPVLWEIFLRSPIYGTGPDHYQAELTRRAMPHLLRQHRTIASHNLVLLLLAETGVIGFMLFMTSLFMVCRSAWRGRDGPLGLVPLALILPMILASLTVSSPISTPVFWWVIAVALVGRGFPSAASRP